MPTLTSLSDYLNGRVLCEKKNKNLLLDGDVDKVHFSPKSIKQDVSFG